MRFHEIGRRLVLPMFAGIGLCSGATGTGAPEEQVRQNVRAAIRQDNLRSVREMARSAGPSLASQALLDAAAIGSARSVKLMLAAGANPNVGNPAGVTPLMLAVGNPQKVRMLLGKGADVNARSNVGKTALMIAADHDGASSTVKMLLDGGANVNLKDETNATALLYAAQSGDTSTIRMLLERGADVNHKAGVGFNEVKFGRPMQLPPGVKPDQGMTALILACMFNNVDAAKLLIAKGADANTGTVWGITPLSMAAARDATELASLLLAKGADVNSLDFEGHTPLMIAAESDTQSEGIVKLLIAKGASLERKGRFDQHSALAWARTKGETPIVKLLLNAGAKE